MANESKQGELLPKGKTAKVAPGRSVQGDLKDRAKLYGPGETVELSDADIAQFTAAGFLTSDKGTTRPLDDGPTVTVQDGAVVTEQ